MASQGSSDWPSDRVVVVQVGSSLLATDESVAHSGRYSVYDWADQRKWNERSIPPLPGRRGVATLADMTRVATASQSKARVQGWTHGVYRYPARFSPEFVRAAIEEYARPGALVADPFVGGGTTAVESMSMGRRFLGFDVNPIAVLLTDAKTTPLPRSERLALQRWAMASPATASAADSAQRLTDKRTKNAPNHLVLGLDPFVAAVSELPTERSQRAARAILLDAGQRVIDGLSAPGDVASLRLAVEEGTTTLIDGLDEFRRALRTHVWVQGRKRRMLRLGKAEALARSRGLNRLAQRVDLVVTSPPYPGVHVLYHRWQVRGRVETPLPYWLAESADGLGPKHYTMGGRTVIGQESYFEEIGRTWAAMHRLVAPGGVVVQLVAFTSPDEQLPRYEQAMAAAGFERDATLMNEWRDVPNRRWYYRVNPERGRASEILLVHRARQATS